MILGADPEELEALAARISQRADSYEHSHQQITYWLNRLSWQGPDAHRFRATYRSSMGPQLVHAAGALRDAASSLRSQAAHQRATSGGRGGVRPHDASLPALLGASILGGVRGQLSAARTLAELGRTIFEYRMSALDAFEIADLVRQAGGDSAALLLHADKLKPFGLERIAGSTAAKTLGWIGAGYAAATLRGDIGELSEDIGAFDWNDQDSIEQFFYSGTDVMTSTGAMLGVTPWAPAGLVLMSTGYVVKGGTAVLPPVVNWGVDNVVWPAWDKAGRPAWDFVSGTAQGGMSWFGDRLYDAGEFAANDIPRFVGGVAESVGDFAGDVAEGAGNVIRDMGETSRRMVENVVNDVASGVRGFLGF